MESYQLCESEREECKKGKKEARKQELGQELEQQP
jgi:hypothetical protein